MAIATEQVPGTRRQRRPTLAKALLAAVAVHSLLGSLVPSELEAFAAKRAGAKAKAKAPSPSKAAKKAAEVPEVPAGPPVRPKNGYMLFAADKRGALMKKGMNVTEIAKDLGKQWKKFTAKKKAPYLKQAEQDKARFEKELAAFEKAGGVMPARKTKKAKAGTVKAKRAPSAYSMYVKERFPQIKGQDESLELGEVSKIIGSEWTEMKPNQKAKYQEQSAKLKQEMMAA